jgi:GT2 family glycosyltransferase
MKMSVLFPIHDRDEAQSALTLEAFHALLNALRPTLGEVIVVDDGSPCQSALRAILDNRTTAIQFRQHRQRRGLVTALNAAASSAAGNILTYCHSDCIVACDALVRIIDVLSENPNAGMTVSELYFPNGRLQQVGGWIGPDFRLCWSRLIEGIPSPIHWGDFWSVRRELFVQDGGLPELYNPGYWECVELAARVRENSMRVLTCPRSRVMHYKSQTFHACFDQKERDSLFERNRQVFAQRWAHRHDEFISEVPRPLEAHDWR